MKLRRVSITAFALAIGSVAMADTAMAARPRPNPAYDLISFEYFQELCGGAGGESIGSLDSENNGEVECFLPDGTKVSCEVVNGRTTHCTSTKRQSPSGGSLVPAPVYDGPDSFTSGTYTSGISTSPRQVLSGPAATRS